MAVLAVVFAVLIAAGLVMWFLNRRRRRQRLKGAGVPEYPSYRRLNSHHTVETIIAAVSVLVIMIGVVGIGFLIVVGFIQ